VKRVLHIAAAVLLAAAGVGLLVFIAHLNNASQRDFIGYWATGQQLVHGGDPYDGAAIFKVQQSAGFNRTEPLIMRNMPVAFFLAWPLGYFSANSGMIVWFVALLLSCVGSIRMIWNLHGRPNNSLHLLGYCFAPVMACLMFGQIGLFLLLGVVLFLTFQTKWPFLAGVSLLVLALKPHIFLPFAVALAVWMLTTKAWRMIAGATTALVASLLFAYVLAPHAWSQYSHMMKTGGALDEMIPVLSAYFRFLVDRHAVWLQFVPQCCACVWALWYFWTRRAHWDWLDHGLVVLLVGSMCTPYAWFTDESLLLPAVLAGVYRADASKRSIVPFGIVAGIAIIELVAHVPIIQFYFLWTTPAWLGWYLYATGRIGGRPKNVGVEGTVAGPAQG
jgi:hypothetical protein